MTGRISVGAVAFALVVVPILASSGGVARAQQAPATAAPATPAPTPAPEMPPPSEAAMPAPQATVPGAEAAPPEASPSAMGGAPFAGALSTTPMRAPTVSYGIGARLRWVSVPKWLLGVFTKKNIPLSSYATALEFYRRKGEFDFIVSVGYQNMSPPDGNWLGRGHPADVDTDYVQFKNLALWGVDASFVWHSYLTDWFGMHYGAGLGLGFLTGQLLRTSNDNTVCNEANAGDYTQCHPKGVTCPAGVGCDDKALAALGSGPDLNQDPHRFRDSNVPSVLPIVNILVGMDFRLPRVRGWEAKIEGGFYDAFFLGGGVGYTF